jgi:Zn-finger nucleic acid-binding protein
MKCPRCQNIELKTEERGVAIDPIEVDVCTGCDGMWLDQSELAGLDDNFFVNMESIVYSAAAATETDGEIQCPRCAVDLFKVHPEGHPDVVIDKCGTCSGFWLDRGELEKINAVSDSILIRSLFD